MKILLSTSVYLFLLTFSVLVFGQNAKLIGTLSSKSAVREIAFSPDSKKLVVASEDGVIMWDVHSLRSMGSPQIDRSPPYDNLEKKVNSRCVAFSPNSMIFATSDIMSIGLTQTPY